MCCPNRLCVLWTSGRLMTAFLKVSCVGFTQYGVDGSLLWVVLSLCNWRESLVWIASSKSDFPVRVGLHQGCTLSQILFITFMDRVSKCNRMVGGVRFRA